MGDAIAPSWDSGGRYMLIFLAEYAQSFGIWLGKYYSSMAAEPEFRCIPDCIAQIRPHAIPIEAYEETR
jgi:hypothetical protein